MHGFRSRGELSGVLRFLRISFRFCSDGHGGSLKASLESEDGSHAADTGFSYQ
jgi:hypothetical protein